MTGVGGAGVVVVVGDASSVDACFLLRLRSLLEEVPSSSSSSSEAANKRCVGDDNMDRPFPNNFDLAVSGCVARVVVDDDEAEGGT